MKKREKINYLYKRIITLEEDMRTIVRALGDLQDMVEGIDEEHVVGGPLHDEEHHTIDNALLHEMYPFAAIEPSNTVGSPYNYLYIYLTERGPDGPHIIVSDAREFGDEEGIVVGRFEHYESDDHEAPVIVHTAADMIAKIQELMNGET